MENEYETEKDPVSMNGGTRKRKGEKPTETRSGDKKALIAVVSIAAAVIIFVILTIIQNKIINSVDETGVVVALVDVPEGIVLTEENMMNYFGMESRPSADVPAGYYTSGHALVGKVTGREIRAKEVVTSNCIIGENLYEDVEDPVEISLSVDKIGQVVGGSLRAGDIIDIKVVIDTSYFAGEEEALLDDEGEYSLDNVPEIAAQEGETGEAGAEEPGEDMIAAEPPEAFTEIGSPDPLPGNLSWLSDDAAESYVYSASGRYASVTVCENVRVVNVYTSAGLDTADAEADGSTQVATVINVVVPRYMEDIIFLAQEDGTLQISRVIDAGTGSGENEEEADKMVQEGISSEAADALQDSDAGQDTGAE